MHHQPYHPSPPQHLFNPQQHLSLLLNSQQSNVTMHKFVAHGRWQQHDFLNYSPFFSSHFGDSNCTAQLSEWIMMTESIWVKFPLLSLHWSSFSNSSIISILKHHHEQSLLEPQIRSIFFLSFLCYYFLDFLKNSKPKYNMTSRNLTWHHDYGHLLKTFKKQTCQRSTHCSTFQGLLIQIFINQPIANQPYTCSHHIWYRELLSVPLSSSPHNMGRILFAKTHSFPDTFDPSTNNHHYEPTLWLHTYWEISLLDSN